MRDACYMGNTHIRSQCVANETTLERANNGGEKVTQFGFQVCC